MPHEEWKRKRPKPHVEYPTQGHRHLPGPLKETPKSSARPIVKQKRENLTLSDWLEVYAYVDTPSTNQPGGGSKILCQKAPGPAVVHPAHIVMQTTAPLGDGGTCGLESKCIVKQTTTHCHKTGCGSCIVAVGSAYGGEVRGCQ